jgi:hypothetical protein
MMYVIEMPLCGMIFLPSFMKVDPDIGGIIMYCLSNLNGYNVGILNGKEIRSTALILTQVA